MSNPFHALHCLLQGAYDTDVPEGEDEMHLVHIWNESHKPKERIEIPDGFTEGCQAWNYAKALGLDIQQVPFEYPVLQGDLFGEEPPMVRSRYTFEFNEIFRSLPYFFDCDKEELGLEDLYVEDADAYQSEYMGKVIATDGEQVMFQCPRGVCYMPIDHWKEGARMCAGC